MSRLPHVESLSRGDVPEGPDPLLRRLILRCRERLARSAQEDRRRSEEQ